MTAHEQRLRALNELVMQLAGDVQTLDLRQQTELARLRARVERLRQQSALQWEAAERDVAALYAERFPPRQRRSDEPYAKDPGRRAAGAEHGASTG